MYKWHENKIPRANRSCDERLLAETQDAQCVSHKLSREHRRISDEASCRFRRGAEGVPRTHRVVGDGDDEVEDIVEQKTMKRVACEVGATHSGVWMYKLKRSCEKEDACHTLS